jgi:hypothetical protein
MIPLWMFPLSLVKNLIKLKSLLPGHYGMLYYYIFPPISGLGEYNAAEALRTGSWGHNYAG